MKEKLETIVYDMPQQEVIPGTRFKRLINKIRAYSVVLGRIFEINPPFVNDEESTPWRGENPLAGIVHDWVCRIGVLESKWLAARVYLEFLKYEDRLVPNRAWYVKSWDWTWRYLKAGTVAVWPKSTYWHKYRVDATVEDMMR